MAAKVIKNGHLGPKLAVSGTKTPKNRLITLTKRQLFRHFQYPDNH